MWSRNPMPVSIFEFPSPSRSTLSSIWVSEVRRVFVAVRDMIGFSSGRFVDGGFAGGNRSVQSIITDTFVKCSSHELLGG